MKHENNRLGARGKSAATEPRMRLDFSLVEARMCTLLRFDPPAHAKAAILTALVAAFATSAHAADMSFKAAYAPPTTYNWSGLYGGANIGGAFSSEDVNSPIGAASTDPSGGLA